MNAEGGYDITQPGDVDAALTKRIYAGGDPAAAQRATGARDDLRYTFPDIASARESVQRDIGATNKETERLGNIIVKSRNRLPGAQDQLRGSGFEGNTLRTLGELADQRQIGAEGKTLDRFFNTGAADIDRLNAFVGANKPLAPAPPFTSGGPGASASASIAQTPPPAPTTDFGGALPFQAGGQLATTLMNRATQVDDRNAIIAALADRTAGDTGSGSWTGTPNTFTTRKIV
jgi:hypothetical protein